VESCQVKDVKNDMVRSVVIESAVTVAAVAEYQGWFQAVLAEAEGM
jgi:hypothetical protein